MRQALIVWLQDMAKKEGREEEAIFLFPFFRVHFSSGTDFRDVSSFTVGMGEKTTWKVQRLDICMALRCSVERHDMRKFALESS